MKKYKTSHLLKKLTFFKDVVLLTKILLKRTVYCSNFRSFFYQSEKQLSNCESRIPLVLVTSKEIDGATLVWDILIMQKSTSVHNINGKD